MPATDKSVEEDQTNAAARRAKGEFVRGVSGFRQAIGDPDFPAEPGTLPSFCRAQIARGATGWCWPAICWGLQESVSMDVAFPNRTG